MNLRGIFDLAKNEKRMVELEVELNNPDIWKKQEKADKLSRQLKVLKAVVMPYRELEGKYEAVHELSLILEDDDTESVDSLIKEIEEIEEGIEKLEFKCILGEEADRCNAIISINAGAGGTESCDWTSMLFRMYLRWAEETSRKFELVDQLNGEETGIKNVTLIVRGDLAYGYLKGESGVHRLVRISPFDSNNRRHTSFASVDVVPEIDNSIEVDMSEGDLRIDTYRASGAGGQHVNVTDSAVRITHIPTGLVSQCQKERSQHKNKVTAMKILRARLYEKKRREQEEKLMKEHGDKKKIEWGSQIRSYVLHPYKMVKDHRTNHQTSNAEKVLDGELETFLEAYLKMSATK